MEQLKMGEVASFLKPTPILHEDSNFDGRLCRSMSQLVYVPSEWVIQHFLFHEANNKTLESKEFSSKEYPRLKWKLKLHLDQADTTSYNVSCCPNLNPRDWGENFLLKHSIVNKKGEKVHLRENKVPKSSNETFWCYPLIDKKELRSKSNELLLNGSLTIFCEIQLVIPKKCTSHQKEIFHSKRNLEEIFQSMKFSDVTIDVRGQMFRAHKDIMISKSKVFAARFDHPTEKMLDYLEVTDIEPDVFLEILRFIYSGQVPFTQIGKKKTIVLLIAADKYRLESLKYQCETQLVGVMSIENCAYLLSLADCHGAFNLKQNALELFRRFPTQVMKTDAWKNLHPIF
ncbi:speckle-type POZ protein-like [Daphnia pulicaria]|uniref:speckle-type POZ protein-like n=1 Tax=Daphnia pulicaria TaxID=35523 RepID=UPI001EEB0131|nr:speckle-type POZ protein-like [Daphnia pulicaria]